MQPIPTRQVLVAVGGLCLLSVVAFRAEASRSFGGSAGSVPGDTGGSDCYAYTPPVDGTLSADGRSCSASDPKALCDAVTELLQGCPDWATAETNAADGASWYWLGTCDGPENLASVAYLDANAGAEKFGFDEAGAIVGFEKYTYQDVGDGWCCEGIQVWVVEAGIYEGDCTRLPDTATDTGATDTSGDSGTPKDGGPCGCGGQGGPVSVAFILLAAVGIRSRALRATPATGR